MGNRKISEEVKSFITERADCSSDRPASIYRQVQDNFKEPISKATVERRVKKVRAESKLRKLANPTTIPSDKHLIELRQPYVDFYPLPNTATSNYNIHNNVIRLYDQVVSMRQEFAEVKELILKSLDKESQTR